MSVLESAPASTRAAGLTPEPAHPPVYRARRRRRARRTACSAAAAASPSDAPAAIAFARASAPAFSSLAALRRRNAVHRLTVVSSRTDIRTPSMTRERRAGIARRNDRYGADVVLATYPAPPRRCAQPLGSGTYFGVSSEEIDLQGSSDVG